MNDDRLSPDDLAYHQHALATLRAAEAAWRQWAAYLAAKYGLAGRDAISERGEIERAPE